MSHRPPAGSISALPVARRADCAALRLYASTRRSANAPALHIISKWLSWHLVRLIMTPLQPQSPPRLKSFPRVLARRGFHRNHQILTSRCVTFQIKIQKRRDEVLIYRGDSILAPHRLIEELTAGEIAQCFRRWWIAS